MHWVILLFYFLHLLYIQSLNLNSYIFKFNIVFVEESMIKCLIHKLLVVGSLSPNAHQCLRLDMIFILQMNFNTCSIFGINQLKWLFIIELHFVMTNSSDGIRLYMKLFYQTLQLGNQIFDIVYNSVHKVRVLLKGRLIVL